MCNKSIDCRSCVLIELCPAVQAAFPTAAEERAAKARGKKSRSANGWWTHSLTKPVAPKNAEGVKLCSKAGCQSPRALGYHLCRAHWEEYYRQYRERKAANHA